MITVVSGLPRSGTSLMMQMLVAGGMEALTDDLRHPDADNPRGYFEYEPVKRTRQDASWVALAVGKVVKVVHLLLNDLPDGFEYRVVMMKRPIREVMASQRVMMERAGKTALGISEDRLARVFSEQIRVVEEQSLRRVGFRVLSVEYHDCVYRAGEVVGALRGFLGLELNAVAMEDAVDCSLHRHRCRYSAP